MSESWRAETYAANARFVSEHGRALVDLLDPRPGERVIDLGCGDGALSEAIAARGAEVDAVDAAPDMVRAAQARGLAARLGRGESLSATRPADAVFSNAALHWMTRPEAVTAAVFAALRPGGRFVAELGGRGNVAALRVALIAALEKVAKRSTDLSEIWWFPSEAEARSRLEAAGFVVEALTLFPRPTPVAAGLEAWFDTLAAPALALAPASERAAVRAEAARLARPALCDRDGALVADYVRLRFVARRPEAPAGGAA